EERVLKMDKSNGVIIFNWLDETTNTIQQHENEPYLDSLSMALETIFFGETSLEMDDLLTHKLEENLNSIHIDTYNREQIRKAIQLAIRSEEHTSELQSRFELVCSLLLETKK